MTDRPGGQPGSQAARQPTSVNLEFGSVLPDLVSRGGDFLLDQEERKEKVLSSLSLKFQFYV